MWKFEYNLNDDQLMFNLLILAFLVLNNFDWFNILLILATKTTLVSYGDDSDSDTEPDSSQPDLKKPQNSKVDESKFIDLSKMACLLCKRQFPNKDALSRHQQLSDLHKVCNFFFLFL